MNLDCMLPQQQPGHMHAISIQPIPPWQMLTESVPSLFSAITDEGAGGAGGGASRRRHRERAALDCRAVRDGGKP